MNEATTPAVVENTQVAYIGLGSNLDNPQQQVRQALLELDDIPHTRVSAASAWYQSRAVGPGDQPDYFNGVAQLHTRLESHALLDALQAIENAHQRVRTLRWGARTLDLDLLLYGDQCISSERLQVPHPYLTQRNFVLYPLADIDPQLVLPTGEVLSELLANSSRDGLQRLAD